MCVWVGGSMLMSIDIGASFTAAIMVMQCQESNEMCQFKQG